MNFIKLRLAGFKSFIDPTDLPIEAGITGVVGPNGCGKSNLIEALRWVMGEASARRMRGTEMDDVIFAGSGGRPARNLAEVGLWLDNRERTAPAAYNDHDLIEVGRRIERGGGSDYRINGRHVRARDVQLLFQDSSSGANSPALVSQGRVSSLVSARPAERRLIIEEAAGIIGLHSRRHEAELRLRAAQDNLSRLDDVIAAMQGQLDGLKKQARQAARYRSLSQRIRKQEATLLSLRWTEATALLAAARQAHAAADGQVGERMLVVGEATREEATAAEALPAKRDAEAKAAAALQRLILAREGLEAEAKRVETAESETRRTLSQIDQDVERERGLAADAESATARLAEEALGLKAGQAGESEAAATLEAEIAALVADLEAADTAVTECTDALTAAEAERRARETRRDGARQQVVALEKRRGELVQQRDRLATALEGVVDLEDARREVASAEAGLAAAVAAVEAADTARRQAEQSAQAATADHDRARTKASEAANRVLRLEAEATGLRSALAGGRDQDLFPPLIDAVTVEPGYEAAFAAALEDDAEAPLDEAAARHWRVVPAGDLPKPLPAAAEPLADRVTAPPVLARRLAHIGVVADAATAVRVANDLAPGQELVTRDGGLWRWDGLTAAAGSPNAAAIRLKQRNRLNDLEGEIAEAGDAKAQADEAVASAGNLADQARRQVEEGRAADRQARQGEQMAGRALTGARERLAEGERRLVAQQSSLAAVNQQIDQVDADVDAAGTAVTAAEAAIAELPDSEALRMALAEARALASDKRAGLAERRGARDRLRQEMQSRAARLSAIDREAESWRTRAAGTTARLAELNQRRVDAAAALEALADRPAQISGERDRLSDKIAAAERDRAAMSDDLAVASTRQTEAVKRLKAAEADLNGAREGRVRAEADVTAAKTLMDGVAERIAERLECPPDRAAQIAGLVPDGELPSQEHAEAGLQRLFRERESLGAVNLRAETEAQELDERIAALIGEREDLIGAINRLRHGIASLNREARDRLLASFETVDRHFQELFVRLFGGGKASLRLTEAEDPLSAGLDIFASPPGKRLQHLSLLSGGEQAMTAIALLFAVFLTNPAPICVLDEVDAPLDDANVDRFCTLLEELAERGDTRFLVITHHRMTMARVDRLFGVTMPERGVSRLVSVDLQQAEILRDAG